MKSHSLSLFGCTLALLKTVVGDYDITFPYVVDEGYVEKAVEHFADKPLEIQDTGADGGTAHILSILSNTIYSETTTVTIGPSLYYEHYTGKNNRPDSPETYISRFHCQFEGSPAERGFCSQEWTWAWSWVDPSPENTDSTLASNIYTDNSYFPVPTQGGFVSKLIVTATARVRGDAPPQPTAAEQPPVTDIPQEQPPATDVSEGEPYPTSISEELPTLSEEPIEYLVPSDTQEDQPQPSVTEEQPQPSSVETERPQVTVTEDLPYSTEVHEPATSSGDIEDPAPTSPSVPESSGGESPSEPTTSSSPTEVHISTITHAPTLAPNGTNSTINTTPPVSQFTGGADHVANNRLWIAGVGVAAGLIAGM